MLFLLTIYSRYVPVSLKSTIAFSRFLCNVSCFSYVLNFFRNYWNRGRTCHNQVYFVERHMEDSLPESPTLPCRQWPLHLPAPTRLVITLRRDLWTNVLASVGDTTSSPIFIIAENHASTAETSKRFLGAFGNDSRGNAPQSYSFFFPSYFPLHLLLSF